MISAFASTSLSCINCYWCCFTERRWEFSRVHSHAWVLKEWAPRLRRGRVPTRTQREPSSRTAATSSLTSQSSASPQTSTARRIPTSHDRCAYTYFTTLPSLEYTQNLLEGLFGMGALLSSILAPIALPLGSFLAIPMLSSWSTGLNLIFLSVAWTTIAASYSPLQLELVAPLVIRLSLYIIPSLIFLLFDIGLPSLAIEFKSQGQWGIPNNQKGGARAVRRVIAWSCANVLLSVALQAGIEFLITDVLQMRSLLLIKGSRWGLNHLPNPWTMVKHGIIGLLSRNVRFHDCVP